jgi:hypothetical protein
MNRLSRVAFRLATLVFAVLLGFECVWLVLAELSRPHVVRLPSDTVAALAAQGKRTTAARAARIGAIRGDLWAESAFTYADLVLGDRSRAADVAREVATARLALDRALDDAPYQSGAWLLLAGLAQRYPIPGSDATEALKMSYYTGPSEPDLMPLRLRIAAQADVFNDIEMRQFVSRDLRLFLARKQRSVVAEAYDAASPAGKRFIEQTVRDLDPSVAKSLGKKQSIPD